MCDILDETLEQLRAYCGQAINLLTLDKAFKNYMAADECYREKNADYLSSEALHILKGDLVDNWDYYYILSFLLQATRQEEVYLTLLRRSISDKHLSKESKYFLYGQLTRYNFFNAYFLSEAVWKLYDELYEKIYEAYLKEVMGDCVMIPKEQRNHDLVFVLSSQILSMGHGPTKALFDRCHILSASLHKKVCIINTAESLSDFQAIPFFNATKGNYIEEYNQVEYITDGDETYAFLQCPQDMPQDSTVREILSVVKSKRPYFIVTIGVDSIVSDLCGNIVPTLTIALGETERTKRWRPFQTVVGTAADSDKQFLEQNRVIESFFTYRFAPQTHFYHREELGLPVEGFIVLIVGYRLDEEIDAEFEKVLQRLADSGIYIAFMGKLHKYQKMMDSYPQFQECTLFLGIQEDTLAVSECCDLFLNPKRIGGGTSAAEALFKGLPVVTLNYGDVATCAGSDFQVADYDEMYQQVIRYSQDRQYYEIMSQKAVARAKILTDSEKEFVRIIRMMEQSSRF